MVPKTPLLRYFCQGLRKGHLTLHHSQRTMLLFRYNVIKKSTGTLYRYTTFDNDLVSSTIEFFDAESYLDNASYYFAGIKVTKKEYETLSKDYLELSKDLKTVYWYEYEYLDKY